jgi:hypothetical protein
MDMSGVDKSLGDLIAAQLGLGKELLKVLGAGSSLLLDSAKGLGLPKGTSCCDIPEPCWMPKSLGEICCTLVPGDSGEVCLDIANEDFRAHEYEILPAGPDAGVVQVQPKDKKFTLGPKERRCVSVKVTVPKDDGRQEPESCCCCDGLDLLIWVKGCANHYLRWTICTDAKKSKDCCHRVCVVDRPDYELHWYDHFHVLRPCPGPMMQI